MGRRFLAPIALLGLATAGCGYALRFLATGGQSLAQMRFENELACPEDLQPAAPAEPAVGRSANARPVRLAFAGDTHSSRCGRAVYRLVRREQANALVAPGDLDYGPRPNPGRWKQQVEEVLDSDFPGGTFPYFASVGNHDAACWTKEHWNVDRCGGASDDAYQRTLRERLERLGLPVDDPAQLGVRSSHLYRGLRLVLLAPGQQVAGAKQTGAQAAAFLERSLATDASAWRIAVWHKNQTLMQACSKPNETGWEPYEAAREAGAIIATAHEHSYSRTHTMVDYRSQAFVLPAPGRPSVVLDAGRNFAFVSGLGGRSIRTDCVEGAWFAQKWTREDICCGPTASSLGDALGALFCDFETDVEPPLEAHCYFKTVSGKVIDRFTIENRRAG